MLLGDDRFYNGSTLTNRPVETIRNQVTHTHTCQVDRDPNAGCCETHIPLDLQKPIVIFRTEDEVIQFRLSALIFIEKGLLSAICRSLSKAVRSQQLVHRNKKKKRCVGG